MKEFRCAEISHSRSSQKRRFRESLDRKLWSRQTKVGQHLNPFSRTAVFHSSVVLVASLWSKPFKNKVRCLVAKFRATSSSKNFTGLRQSTTRLFVSFRSGNSPDKHSRRWFDRIVRIQIVAR